MKVEKLGELRARISGGPDGRGGGDGPVVVLMHGFGAPGTDLVPLGAELERTGHLPKGTRFVFPEAPIAFELGFGESRAWWMIDLERMQRAMMTGRTHELVREEPEGLAEAHRKVVGLLDAVESTLGVTGDRLVLGGFSQGAMLSTDVALRTDRRLAGLALLSGSLLAEATWLPRLAARRGLPVFQSHGTFDPILPYAVAAELSKHFVAAGLEAELVTFAGGHELDGAVLSGLARFLGRVLAPKT